MEGTAGKKLDFEIDTIIFDVDGVFTDGQFTYTSEGKRTKIFGPHDNDGIKLLRKHEFELQVITADKRGFSITQKRIETDMKLPLTLVTEMERLDWLQQNYPLERCIYMGDGWHDAAIFPHCGYSIAPQSALQQAKAAADFVTEASAAHGAVFEACLHILQQKNLI